MICSHPKCIRELGTKAVLGKINRLPYCSEVCRARDVRRRIQNKRRETQEQKDYERRQKLASKYGITPEVWEAFYVLQDGLCAICLVPLDGIKICTDHDHENDVVRGLLCSNCNVFIGMAEEDIDRLRRAIAYLQRSRGEVMAGGD